jgi:hypothetical protein
MSNRKILPMITDAKGTTMKRRLALCLMVLVASIATARAGTEACSTPQTPEEIRRCDPGVTMVAVRKDEFFLSRGSGVFALRAGQPIERATVLVPPRPGREIDSIHPALDAIYVVAREGGNTHLLRVPVRCDGVREVGFTQKYACHSRNCRSFPARGAIRVIAIPLPVASHVAAAHADPDERGITLSLVGPARKTVTWPYDPAHAVAPPEP